MLTLQPTVLWDFPTFRSRIGVHFVTDVGSPYALMPVSGIGVTGYFYLSGISSAYDSGLDGVLVQKSKPGLFVFGGLTPVNFNINIDETNSTDSSTPDVAFSAFLVELSMGFGFDYPLRRNLLLSLEIGYRAGAAPSSDDGDNISYSGLGAMLVFGTSYY